MINVQEIRRNVINVVKNYSDAQVKVRKATSNEPWGPSSTLMGEIADLTYNVVAFSEIMQIIWKRLNDHGKNWRHVYKALVLLEYLIKTGSEKVAQQCRDNLFAIQTLKDFQYFEENKDQGLSIREKSKMLVNLLKDEEKLKTERTRALKAKERFAQSLSMGASLESASDLPRTSSSYHESLSSESNSSPRPVNTELESARPQTVGEEELQLQLALAMSKEEAEQEERLRKNDDLRLKLALEESEKSKSPESRSAVDDLLSLNPAPTQPKNDISTDPWGSPVNKESSFLPSPNKSILQQDPWGGTLTSNTGTSFINDKNSFDDSWATTKSSVTVENDPWSMDIQKQVPNSDPWNINGKSNDIRLGDIIEPSKTFDLQNDTSIRRTPENFLGSNSNLVNLDALVSSKNITSTSPSNNNPFAPIVQVSSNPFQSNKPSQPTINQLRAQSIPIGGGINNYSNNSALSSLFSTPLASNTGNTLPTVQTSNMSQNSALAAVGSGTNGSTWANFPSSQQQSQFPSTFAATSPQNNPFAM